MYRVPLAVKMAPPFRYDSSNPAPDWMTRTSFSRMTFSELKVGNFSVLKQALAVGSRSSSASTGTCATRRRQGAVTYAPRRAFPSAPAARTHPVHAERRRQLGEAQRRRPRARCHEFQQHAPLGSAHLLHDAPEHLRAAGKGGSAPAREQRSEAEGHVVWTHPHAAVLRKVAASVPRVAAQVVHVDAGGAAADHHLQLRWAEHAQELGVDHVSHPAQERLRLLGALSPGVGGARGDQRRGRGGGLWGSAARTRRFR